MPLNFDLAGKTYDALTHQVTPESIALFAAAARIDNPRHLPGSEQAAPVTYPAVYAIPATVSIASDPELSVDNPLMIVHGEHDIVHHRPIEPGETLAVTPSLESVEDKGKGATYVAKVAASTPDGEAVNDQFATIFVRGGGSGEQRPKGDKPAPLARHEQVATFHKHVDYGMPQDYAEASGDRNPIHLSDDVAHAVGLPGVINHGMGTLAVVSGGLVDELADGDPTGVHRLQVRFTDLVFPGSDLDTTVWKSEHDGFVFETTRPDGTVVMVGLAEVAS